MQFFFASLHLPSSKWLVAAALVAFGTLAPRSVSAEALLVVEVDSGKVLQAENATYPWHPASVTKLMTTYVTLQAVKQGRLSLDTLVTVSPIAASQSPSKMGFKSGTQVTIDNALKMMMVKSANDMAVVLAEGVGGSVDGFSAMMNATAQKLGMTQTHYVNPNGLPADEQVTSARDLAILARAIIHDLPEYEYFVHIPAIKFGRRVTPNFNRLIGRFPGADGMKTGFICASGYNLVATATRGNKRLIAVVLGASSGQARAVKAAQLLERGFGTGTGGLTWLKPALGTVDALAPIDAAPPNLRDEMCGPKRKRPASDADDEAVASNEGGSQAMSFFTAGLQPPTLRPVDMIAAAAAPTEPVIVYTGPKKVGADLIAANAVEEAKQTPKPRGKKGTKTAAKKQDADPKPTAAADAKPAAKPTAKPSPKQAVAKPDTTATKPAAAAKPAAAKPATAGVTTTAPAKPKTAAKPAPKATTGEAKPAVTAPRS